jgi:hypothetical protein
LVSALIFKGHASKPVPKATYSRKRLLLITLRISPGKISLFTLPSVYFLILKTVFKKD